MSTAYNIAIVHRNRGQREIIRASLLGYIADIRVNEYELAYDAISSSQGIAYHVMLVGYNRITLKCAEIANLKRTFPDTRIILYGGNVDFQQLLPFISVGVEGYLTARSGPETIWSSIKTVLAGRLCFEVSVKPDSDLPQLPPAGFRCRLSRRENEIVDYLLLGFSPSEISNLVDRKISTVSTIKRRVFDKLDIRNVLELFQMANP